MKRLVAWAFAAGLLAACGAASEAEETKRAKALNFVFILTDELIEWFEDNRVELYNLAADPSERRDLASQQAGRAAEMRRQLHAWRDKVKAALPTRNPDFK